MDNKKKKKLNKLVLSRISYLLGIIASVSKGIVHPKIKILSLFFSLISSQTYSIRPLTFAYIHTCRIGNTQEPMMFGVKPGVTHDKPSLCMHKWDMRAMAERKIFSG